MKYLLVFLMLVAPVHSYVLSVNEDLYGENQVRINREAEVAWVKDNVYIIYDYMSRKNKYVSQLNDEDIEHILRNPFARKRVGIDDADLTEYTRQRKEKSSQVLEAKKRQRETAEYFRKNNPAPVPDYEKDTTLDLKEKRIQCIRKRTLTIYDPLYRGNRWLRSITNEDIGRILTHTRNFVTAC